MKAVKKATAARSIGTPTPTPMPIPTLAELVRPEREAEEVVVDGAPAVVVAAVVEIVNTVPEDAVADIRVFGMAGISEVVGEPAVVELVRSLDGVVFDVVAVEKVELDDAVELELATAELGATVNVLTEGGTMSVEPPTVVMVVTVVGFVVDVEELEFSGNIFT